jgi:hypothetical protein
MQMGLPDDVRATPPVPTPTLGRPSGDSRHHARMFGQTFRGVIGEAPNAAPRCAGVGPAWPQANPTRHRCPLADLVRVSAGLPDNKAGCKSEYSLRLLGDHAETVHIR